MPTVQFTDDFNHSIDATYYTGAGFFNTTGATPVQVTSPVYQSGTTTLKNPYPGGTFTTGVRRDITSPGRWGWMGWAFQIGALPSSDTFLAYMQQTGGVVNARLACTAGGSLYAYIVGAANQNYSGNPISAGVWYWVEFILDCNDGAGNNVLYWRVNGVDQGTSTWAIAAGNAGRLFQQSFNTGIVDYYVGIWKGGIPTGATDWLGEPSAASQLLAPSADSVDGAWTDQSGGTSLFAAIDETTASDTDYIRSPLSPSSSACRVKLTAGGDPSSSTGHKINWRVGKDVTGGQTIGATVTLRQGGGDSLGAGTQIATFTRSNVDAFTTYTETLSGGEADSITNYADLYLEFSGNAT